ncbi:MAG TPA: gamma-glutamyl-gamma-aminobutyrate hydrolase family protein [Vicinamibacterales bacterium]|jgi:putative glutamine amidotransferase|nr:gamma-glutamyl-gamma-aminobutyrate hydrolase family protein [Vicinamibacterales bacterium]
MKPVIGITRNRRPADYEQAIRAAGGEFRILDWEHTSARAAIESVDGLMLTGGGDVHPEHYGRTMSPQIELAEPGRDEFEIALSREALQRDLPILAICRGLQVLNVAAGGTLLQHVPDAVGGGIAHSIDNPKNAIAHAINVKTGSTLARVLGPRVDGVEACAVNSRHHQAVDAVAPGFTVSATAPDGIVEAIERADRRFCVGVEWHPENFWATGEFAGLFEAFVRACSTRL